MKPERALCTLLMLALAGCSGGGNWTRAGLDEAATAREYEDCRDLAGTAVRTDADIDQDIAATRNEDRQRGSVMRVQTQTMHEHTRDRADAIIARCMRAKGFGQP
jgi:hypothetical protein